MKIRNLNLPARPSPAMQFFMDRMRRAFDDHIFTFELLDGPDFWMSRIDNITRKLPEICWELAAEIFTDYYNPELRDIFADCLEQHGFSHCDTQRAVARKIRAARIAFDTLNDRLTVLEQRNDFIVGTHIVQPGRHLNFDPGVLISVSDDDPLRGTEFETRTRELMRFQCSLVGRPIIIKTTLTEASDVMSRAKKTVREMPWNMFPSSGAI